MPKILSLDIGGMTIAEIVLFLNTQPTAFTTPQSRAIEIVQFEEDLGEIDMTGIAMTYGQRFKEAARRLGQYDDSWFVTYPHQRLIWEQVDIPPSVGGINEKVFFRVMRNEYIRRTSRMKRLGVAA